MQLIAPTPTPALLIHVELLLSSYELLLGRPLLRLEPQLSPTARFLEVFEAPFVLVSHGTEEDPVFNFANRAALQLWEMSFEEFTALPSRYSAEEGERSERARMLSDVRRQGYSNSYSGIRASKSGRRFRIEEATVFNLIGASSKHAGQAATFKSWTPV